VHPVVDDVHRRLVQVAVTADAAPMARYMKDRFAFLGVRAPARRAATRPVIRESTGWPIDEVVAVAEGLRERPERECHYVASDLLAHHASRLRASDLAAMRRLVVEDAWWDTVDALASPTIGRMVLDHPEVAAAMDDWVDDDDLWLRRVALLHQLRFGDLTDADRLFRYCSRRGTDPEFFVRKAIGWALRQYARTDPIAVRAFVDDHRDGLAPLSVREATRHL
jgi:3-methyladenine DNA glycosylase AlkD